MSDTETVKDCVPQSDPPWAPDDEWELADALWGRIDLTLLGQLRAPLLERLPPRDCSGFGEVR